VCVCARMQFPTCSVSFSRQAPIPELFFGCFFCHNVSAVAAAVALFKQQEDGAS
jgi:hypothetical protein